MSGRTCDVCGDDLPDIPRAIVVGEGGEQINLCIDCFNRGEYEL